MKKISSKPTVYLIDGSNFSRSFWSQAGGGKPDALEAEFIQWLAQAARTQAFSASSFRVVFDGGFRSSGVCREPSINVYFSEEEKADDILLERACFMKSEGTRAVIVTSDREIREQAASDGIKSLTCGAFFGLCENEIRKAGR